MDVTMSKTVIKICGIRNAAEASWLPEEVDYAGFVLFYPKSKRNITPEAAKEAFSALKDGIKKVAVTVKPTLSQVLEIEKAGFDYVQIHGEVEEKIFGNTSIPIIKAFNVSDLSELEKYSRNERIHAFVLDSAVPGSGKSFDWELVNKPDTFGKPVILAGGLNPENVATAIKTIHPYGVDVSSGVEGENGKDEGKIKGFVQAVRNVDGGKLFAGE